MQTLCGARTLAAVRLTAISLVLVTAAVLGAISSARADGDGNAADAADADDAFGARRFAALRRVDPMKRGGRWWQSPQKAALEMARRAHAALSVAKSCPR